MTVAHGTPSITERLRDQVRRLWNREAKDLMHEAAARIIQLEAENAALSAQVVELQRENKRHVENYAHDCVVMTRYVPAFGHLSDAINQLGGQVVELQKDAQRYRHLRADPERLYNDNALHWSAEQMDAAIDAEMAGA